MGVIAQPSTGVPMTERSNVKVIKNPNLFGFVSPPKTNKDFFTNDIGSYEGNSLPYSDTTELNMKQEK